jgi:hypothetical protein
MSTELILLIVGYLILLAAGLLWITLDAETAYIFDVFGKQFDYMWYHSGQRWKFTFMYGWRLLTLVLLIAVCAYLAWLLVSAISDWRAAAILLFVTLTVIPLCLLPWIKAASRIRFQRILHNRAKQLTPVAQSLAAAQDISAILDDAQYRTEPDWSSWHPKSIDDWPEIVPVAYVHSPPAVTILFPVDWDTFLAWKLLGQLPDAGSLLPFNGPFDSTFVLRQVRPLHGEPDWTLVHAELLLNKERRVTENNLTAT